MRNQDLFMSYQVQDHYPDIFLSDDCLIETRSSLLKSEIHLFFSHELYFSKLCNLIRLLII